PLMDENNYLAVNADLMDVLHSEIIAQRGAGVTGPRGMAGYAWQLTSDKRPLEEMYLAQTRQCDLLEYINTEGSLWIDRVGVSYADVQRHRLGGIALTRNNLFPGHTVSWEFERPANDQSMAILVKEITPTGFKVVAYNLTEAPVQAEMR